MARNTTGPKYTFDPVAELRMRIQTNEANIGHFTRRGDLNEARQLESQTERLRYQLESWEAESNKQQGHPKVALR
jgi:hypothetical protein